MRVRSKYYVLCIKGFFVFFTYILLNTFYLLPVHAVYDPLSVPNNKFGIHLIQAIPSESSPAAELVNTNGDWGYITVLIESKDRNPGKWQAFFDDLRQRHLIPIVRLATKPLNEHWERPDQEEEESWANFLNQLNWPIKNRYITVYNEPNHATEWGNSIDPASYAKVLDRTISALKRKSEDFFVMNAGFDASAPPQPPRYEDQLTFMKKMNEEIPGIFGKLDGWVSHSYPNPEFAGSPGSIGRGTVRTWYWELQQLRSMGVTRNLPVFILETGWKHSEGINYNPNYPSPDKVATYFKNAFENAWASQRIVAVTPFLLNYQQAPFDYFSFKKVERKPNIKLTASTSENTPEYHPQFYTIKDMLKTKGQPIQENKAQLIKGEVYSNIVAGETYSIFITVKNIGQSIWNDNSKVSLIPVKGGAELGISKVEIQSSVKVDPGKEYTFNILLKAPEGGKFGVKLQLFANNKPFDSTPLEFTTEVKSPVFLQILANLKWKKSAKGEYTLSIRGATGDTLKKILLNEVGQSEKMEARYLLPNYTFDFTLESGNYHPKLVSATLREGENLLDFGELQPSLLRNILSPKKLWNLLPFSN